MPSEEISPRNSTLRNTVAPYLEYLAKNVAEHAPYITPNMITIGATVGSLAIDRAIVRYPENRFGLGWLRVGLTVMDAFDGALAREKAKLDPNGSSTNNNGQLLDAACDKIQEVSIAMAAAETAYNQGDRAGAALHIASGITSSWPAIMRSKNELAGNIVGEGLWGARTGRFILNINATSINADRISPNLHRPIANVLGAMSLWQNVSNANKRRQALKPGSEHVIGVADSATAQSASARLKILNAINIGAISYLGARAYQKTRS